MVIEKNNDFFGKGVEYRALCWSLIILEERGELCDARLVELLLRLFFVFFERRVRGLPPGWCSSNLRKALKVWLRAEKRNKSGVLSSLDDARPSSSTVINRFRPDFFLFKDLKSEKTFVQSVLSEATDGNTSWSIYDAFGIRK